MAAALVFAILRKNLSKALINSLGIGMNAAV
jgi:hypothetical protein